MSIPFAVEELLEAKEGEGIQFKEAKTRFDSNEAARCCCALSNCGGGKLVFGITDKRPRQVVGSTAFEQPERTRMGLIDKLKVMVDFHLYDYSGKRILVFDVASRPLGMPVQVDGIAWWYEGDSLIPLKRLEAMGIVEHIGRSKYILSHSLYAAVGKSGVYTRKVGLDRDTNKELLLKHIRKNGSVGTQFKELCQVLPGQTHNQIQVLLRELRNENRIYCVGKTKGARWFALDGKNRSE